MWTRTYRTVLQILGGWVMWKGMGADVPSIIMLGSGMLGISMMHLTDVQPQEVDLDRAQALHEAWDEIYQIEKRAGL